MLKPFESFPDTMDMPLKKRWQRALNDPGYLGLWAGLGIFILTVLILVS